jgi:hypothetical protein
MEMSMPWEHEVLETVADSLGETVISLRRLLAESEIDT